MRIRAIDEKLKRYTERALAEIKVNQNLKFDLM